MKSFKEEFQTVLEIGPGCGLLSFFLKQDESLISYQQIESCQSLYLLQSAINLHAFGSNFKEHAFPTTTDDYEFFSRVIHPPWNEDGYYLDYLELPEVDMICEHFPWWKIGEVAKNKNYFDIITSNANLNEFTLPALHMYMKLHKEVLKEDGLILIQGPGADYIGRRKELPHIFSQHSFAVVVFACTNSILENTGEPDLSRTLVDDNILLIREGHPLYGKYIGKEIDTNASFFGEEDFVARMFFQNTSKLRKFDSLSLKSLVKTRIDSILTEMN